MLGQLADALLDVGCYEARLVVSVAELRELQAEVERCAVDEEQLRLQRIEVERLGREREALLRFATSELRFDHLPAPGGALGPEIQQKVSGLEARLDDIARETEDALAAITEREIALAARRASRDEALESACSHLDAVLKELTPRFLDDGSVAEMAVLLREARSAVMRHARSAPP
jgi:hypothetical protein